MIGEIPKKRILFVDDEPLVLEGLKRTLRRIRGIYDMEFADGGAQALEIMAQRSFDVVVTDMRMPGMNGAELLHAVMEHYPNTIRFVLSGYADQEMIAQCHGVAHQFLSKPCDPDVLGELINQSDRLRSELSNEEVVRVLSRIERIPSVPALYHDLSKALASEASSDELGRIISKDIGMTAKILKLVNSAFFGLRREVSSPVEAVTYLGVETIRSLVLVHGIFGTTPLKTRHISIEDLWLHSLSVANGARSIAQMLDSTENPHDHAFSGGLLHDVGILILAHNFPETYDEAIDQVIRGHQTLSTVEKVFFDVRHEEVGAYLMGLWGLPQTIVRSIRDHHAPSVQDGPWSNEAYTVHLADAILGPKSKHPAWENLTVDPRLAALPRVASQLDRMRTTLQSATTNS